jgi:hypothetical protein
MDGVPCLAQFVGERAHTVGESLHVVVQHDISHFCSSPSELIH